MATIRVLQNGPFLVDGDDVTIVDSTGAAFRGLNKTAALCRCGSSATRPFCDGTHAKVGFQSAERAPAD